MIRNKWFLGGTDTHLLNVWLEENQSVCSVIFFFWFWREIGFKNTAGVYSQEIISVYYWPNIKADCFAYEKVLNS